MGVKPTPTVSTSILYLSILIIAVCGIIYELIIGTVSAYLWGDSIWYFSVTIGLYMSALGLGAYLSKFLNHKLFDAFVLTEIGVGLIGGCSALLLFWVYALTDYYEVFMVLITLAIGGMVGLEIPLLIRVLENKESLKDNVANVLTYDYIGGLFGALLFPVLLLPFLGIIKTALLLGILNLLVACLNFWRNRVLLSHMSLMAGLSLLVGILLTYLLITSQHQSELVTQQLYRDKVVFTQQTPYQKLTLTQWHKDIRLYINGHLQFSSLDEYRYHESLVHIPLSVLKEPTQVLILGGGDGLAIRELLKYPTIKKIVLVDLDPAMIQVSRDNPLLNQLNQGSLESSKLQIINQDAYKYIENSSEFFDAILIDLPDPNHTALAKLYSRTFYELIARRLNYRGVMVTQSTSPYFAREAYWCIHQTLKQTSLNVYPYHVEVPSFGNWGFQLATKEAIQPEQLKLKVSLSKLKFLNQSTLTNLFKFPQDLRLNLATIQPNTIIRPILLNYYQKGWESMR